MLHDDELKHIATYLPCKDLLPMLTTCSAFQSQDFWHRMCSVYNYLEHNEFSQELIENNNWREIFKRNYCNIFSGTRILTDFQQHCQLNEWYGKTQRWKCIYRASETNYEAEKFHDHCDNKGENFVIIKCTAGNIFGSYISKSWHCDSWTNDPKAFCKFYLIVYY
jgi:hypothetical protein